MAAKKMATKKNGPVALTLRQRFLMAVKKLRRRSDVVVFDYEDTSQGRFGKVRDQMPQDLRVVYDAIGATRLHWRFADDPEMDGDAPMRRGGLILHAPTNDGWLDPTYMKPFPDQPRFYRGLLREDDGYFRDWGEEPWPEGTCYVILEGREEWGTLWRVDATGESSYQLFGSDGETEPMPLPTFLENFEAFMASGFVGTLGRPDVPYAALDTAPDDPSVRNRLAEEVPPRATADVKVLENRPLDWASYRAARLGTTPGAALPALEQVLGLTGLADLSWLERGRRLAEATTEPRMPEEVWIAVNRAVSNAKRNVTFFNKWRVLKEGEPRSLVTLEIKGRSDLPERHYGFGINAYWAATKALLELPGFKAPEGFDLDLHRYTETPHEKIEQLITKWDADSSLYGALIHLTAPTAWVEDIEVGEYESPAQW